LADPVTGEGISAAIESGTLAARAIVEGEAEPARVSERYDRSLLGLRREVKIGRALARLTYERPWMRRWVFGRHGQKIVEGMIDVLTGDRTYASQLGRAKTWAFLLGLARR
jgi:flavin-dependent dehydrogenase